MAVKKSGLGKGLDSLIPKQAPRSAEKAEEKTVVKTVVKKEEMRLKVAEIEPNRISRVNQTVWCASAIDRSEKGRVL